MSRGNILVTGGCGYIGLHTIVDLMQNGYNVICVDDNSRSDKYMIVKGIKKIVGYAVDFYCVDMKNLNALKQIFDTRTIDGVIHFAAYKSVVESVSDPIMYYKNNLESLVNLLYCVDLYQIPHVVFSSSCTVYGTPSHYPVNEKTPMGVPNCPYGATKQMGEQILHDFARRDHNMQKICILRYFNPAGAHPSLEIGEDPRNGINSLTSAIVGVASGRRPGPLTVFGNDYPTRDGTCIRDFIHVCDIASAHTKALEYMIDSSATVSLFNLGSGSSITVKEAICAFEKSTGVPLNYTIGPRREGDTPAIYADITLAVQELNWEPKYTIHDIMTTAWGFEKRLKEKKL